MKNFPWPSGDDLEFATAAIRFSEGPESAQGGRIGPISPDAVHPELKARLANANEGDLIDPFTIGDMHLLLRLDTRITTRLDETLQNQLLQELYDSWLDRQLSSLEVGDSIEPPEYIQPYDCFHILKAEVVAGLCTVQRRQSHFLPHKKTLLQQQLDVGHELAAENVPMAHVVLVVEGTLRVSGRDAMGTPFTLRRVHAGEWWGLWSGLSGVSAATCRTTETTKLLAVPVELWRHWFGSSSELSKWLESHPQREDIYAALRPLLAERPHKDRTFLDEIDHLQVVMRSAQIVELETLEALC